MNTEQILELLQTTNPIYLAKDEIKEKASAPEIVNALKIATNSGEFILPLTGIIGELHIKEAVPLLIQLLEHSSSKVRSMSADSLAKIKDEQAGPFLLRCFEKEPEESVKKMVIVALGAVNYQPAIQLLIELLKSDDGSMRGSAAWSLGNLKAIEAKNSLERALRVETFSYAQQRMEEALAILKAE